MNPHRCDAYFSPRVAAELIGIPIARVLALLAAGSIRLLTIQGRRLVSLSDVEGAVGREGRREHIS